MAEDPWKKYDEEAQAPPAAASPWDKYSVPPGDAAAMPGTTAPAEVKPWGERATDAAAYYEKLLRLGTNAMTFGMADRAAALGESLTGGAPSYAEALKKEAGLSEQIRRDNPDMAVAADVVGGGIGGMGLARAGLTTAGRFAAAPWYARGAAAGAEGAVQGAAQGAGHTYSGNPMDYATAGGKGALVGGALGAPAPALGQLAGAAYRGVADQGYRGGIPGTLAQAAQNDVVGLRTLPRRGPAAMLPDAGPSMLGAAQGAVLGTEGPGATSLVRNLKARDATSPQRIAGETNQIFGPAPTPSYVERAVRERMRGIGPEYDTLLNSPNTSAIDNSALALRLEGLIGNERGETQTALRSVRGMLDIPTNPGELDPHPRALHATREQVRGMMNDAKYNNTTRARLREIYGDLTQEIQQKVPGIRELDSRYRELGMQEEAATTASAGARIFDKGREGVIRPTELRDTMVEAAQPKGINIGPSAEPVRLRQSARAELDRIVGGNKNDLLVLENTLGRPGDWNIEKLGIMFGRERAARMMQVLDNERLFRDTHQNIVEKSQTAQRLAAKEAQEAKSGKIPYGFSMLDLVIKPTQWAKDKLTQTGAAATRDRIAQIMSTNDPQAVQALIPELLGAAPTRDARENIIRTLVQQGIIGGGAAFGGSPVVPKEKRR